MSDLRKAAGMALEALENYKQGNSEPAKALRQALSNEFNPDWNQVEALQESLREHMAEIQRLRQALAQPEQWKHCRHCGFQYRPPKEDKWHPLAQPKQEPVAYSDVVSDGGLDPRNAFDTAPPKRKWVGLSDEDKDELLNLDNWTDIVEAVEAKLKEKNT